MKSLRYLSIFIFITFLAVGCGSGGGGGGDDSPTIPPDTTPAEVVLQGHFIDSAVSGLSFDTDNESGVTDTDGTFFYQEGETVSFSVGDIPLGSAPGGSHLSPFDLADGAVDVFDFKVVNMARFLQSLDNDGNPDNGIVITDEVKSHLAGRSIDFSQTTADFTNDPEVKGLFSDLNDAGVFGTPRTLVSRSTALAHMMPNILPSLGKKVSASGTYTHNSEDDSLSFYIAASEFPENMIPVGVLKFKIKSVTATSMVLLDPDDDSTNFSRESGNDGDYTGTWKLTEMSFDTLLTVDIKNDGTVEFVAFTVHPLNVGYPTMSYAGLGFHNNPDTASMYIQVENKEDCIDTITADLKGPAVTYSDIPFTYYPDREEWGVSSYIIPETAGAGIWYVSRYQLNCSDGSSSTYTTNDPYETYVYEGRNSDGSADSGRTSNVIIAQDYVPPTSGTMYYIETFQNGSSEGRVDPYVKVYESSDISHWIAVNDDGGRGSLDAGIKMPMSPGKTYYICAEDIYNNEGAYSISINRNGFSDSSSGTVNDPDSYEPDDSYMYATPLELDITQDHYFTSGEFDCFSFTPPSD